MKKQAILLILTVLFALSASGVDLSPEQKTNTDIIAYGIETQVMELLTRLRNVKDSFYNDQLLALFRSSRSSTLRRGILEFFTGMEDGSAIEDAVQIVNGRFDETSQLVNSAFAYLTALKSAQAYDAGREIIENRETAWLPSAIRLIGAIGNPEIADLLVELYKNPETSTANKEQLLLALGALPSESSFNLLADLLDDASASRIEQMYAATGLGNMGNSNAVPVLQKAIFSSIPEVRARAIRALSSFPAASIEDSIVEALKDPHVTPRVAAVQAVGTLKLEKAIPFLEFRLQFDPERTVREASIQSLAAIGTERSFEILAKYLEDEKNTLSYRSLIFMALVENAEHRFSETLKKILETSMAASDRAFVNLLARGIASMSNVNSAPYLGILLGDKDFAIRLGALVSIERQELRSLTAQVAAIAKEDNAEAVRKRAEQTLSRLSRNPETD